MKKALLFLLLSFPAHAAPFHAPANPQSLAWQQHQGAQLPLHAPLTDEAGHSVTLADFTGRVPVILDLGYYRCPSLCGVVRADLYNALSNSGLVPGRDYVLAALSIDPAETPLTASQARASDSAQYAFVTPAGFHYLTGPPQSVSAIAGAIGFPDRYDARFRQFMHPSGLTFLTPQGRISGYLLGVGYSPGDVRAAILRASQGGIARAALPVLLLCFHFDPNTGRYTLAIMKLLRLMGVLTILGLAALIVVLHRANPRARA